MYLVPTALTGRTPDVSPAVALGLFAALPATAVALVWAIRPDAWFTPLVTTLTPAFSVLAGLGACWATENAAMGQLVLFLIPVLFAAQQLSPRPAVATALLAIAALTWLTFRFNPGMVAVNDTALVGTAITMLTFLILRTRAHRRTMLTQLSELSERDPLTGALTRERIDALLEERSRATGALETSLMLIDVNAFKTINDDFGHPVGDAVLIDVVRRLQGLIGPDDAVGRFGGDEFVVVLTDTSATDARERGTRLQAALSGMFDLCGPTVQHHQVRYSLSVGLSHRGRHNAFAESMYAGADQQLYQAKRQRQLRQDHQMHEAHQHQAHQHQAHDAGQGS